VVRKMDKMISDAHSLFSELEAHIINCWISRTMLFEKLVEASDLSGSFKFKVRDLLKHSFAIIEEVPTGVELKIDIQY
jgi:hypothetical protein